MSAYRLRSATTALAAFAILGSSAAAQQGADPRTVEISARLRPLLDAYHAEGGFPGATIGYTMPDGSSGSVSAGLACAETEEPMTGEHRMMAGSAGKTLWAAAALLLVEDGVLDLDAKISAYIGAEAWFNRLPGAADITVRMLMNHTSGIPRYVMLPAFTEAMQADPGRRWDWQELLAFIFDADPLFAPGSGWSYADTNYIVLGVIIEKVTGDSFYNLVHDRILRPRALWDIVPTTSCDIPGLACGYVDEQRNLFGLSESNVLETGRYVFNPQFEWAGGGFASTPRELARWAHLLYHGGVLRAETRHLMLDGAPSPALGAGSTYGLGVMMRNSPAGRVLGHAGYFPGYVTDVAYYADHGLALALQVNTTKMGPQMNPMTMQRLLDTCAEALVRSPS